MDFQVHKYVVGLLKSVYLRLCSLARLGEVEAGSTVESGHNGEAVALNAKVPAQRFNVSQ